MDALFDIINLGTDYTVHIAKTSEEFFGENNIWVTVNRYYNKAVRLSCRLEVSENDFKDPEFFRTLLEEAKNKLSDEACKLKLLKMMHDGEE